MKTLRTLSQAAAVKELDGLDAQYPNFLHMPTAIKDRWLILSQHIINTAWRARKKATGSIHSHLAMGESMGA